MWQRSLAPGSKPLKRPRFGGVGYDSTAPVNPQCKTCRGAGVRVVVHQDHTTLSAGQRGRIEGVNEKADGTIETVQAAKFQARKLLHDLRGDVVKHSTVAVGVAIVQDVSPDALVTMLRSQRARKPLPVSEQ